MVPKPPLTERECGFSGFWTRSRKHIAALVHVGSGTDPAKVPTKRSARQRLVPRGISTRGCVRGRWSLPNAISFDRVRTCRLVTSFGSWPSRGFDSLRPDSCPVRLSAKTPGHHPGKRGSILLRDTRCGVAQRQSGWLLPTVSGGSIPPLAAGMTRRRWCQRQHVGFQVRRSGFESSPPRQLYVSCPRSSADRVSGFEPAGRRFDSSRGYNFESLGAVAQFGRAAV